MGLQSIWKLQEAIILDISVVALWMLILGWMVESGNVGAQVTTESL